MPETAVPSDIKMSSQMTTADWEKTFDISFSIHPSKLLPQARGMIVVTAPPTAWVRKTPFRFSCPAGGVIAFTLPAITIPVGAVSLDAELTGIEWDPSSIASFTLVSKADCDDSVDGEPLAWTAQLPRAQGAVAFWSKFLDLRMGANNDPIDAAGQASLVRMMRALSWTESKDGTGTGTQPVADPCQCGNPNDSWWKELTGPAGSGDYLQTGSGGGYYAGDLVAAAQGDATFIPSARLDTLANQSNGHNDPNFNADMSYVWAVPLFLHKMNHYAGRTTAQCGSFSDTDAINGGVAYNGGGDPECYRSKYTAALNSIGPLIEEESQKLVT